MIFCSAPALVSLEVLLVNNEPVDRLRLATLAPLLLRMVKVEVEPCCRSRVVDPPVKETLVSAILMSLKVLVPLKVWVVDRSASVTVPVGMVAVVPPAPVVKVTALAPETVKAPPSASAPVVQVGVPAAAETRACPDCPTVVNP